MKDSIRIEIHNHPKPWFEHHPFLLGFKYDVVGQPKEEKFYGVGCKTWWYQWSYDEK